MSEKETKAMTPKDFEDGMYALIDEYRDDIENGDLQLETSEHLLSLVLGSMDLMMEALGTAGYREGVETWKDAVKSRDWFISIFGF